MSAETGPGSAELRLPDRLVTYAEAIERTRQHKREAEWHEQEAQRWAAIAESKR